MAPVIVILLYGAVILLIKAILPIEMNSEVRLILNVVSGIGALVLPIVIYSKVDLMLTKRAVELVGKNWCLENKLTFEKVEMYKNHFALIFRDGGEKVRKNFRVRFIFTTWIVKSVEWLAK